MREVRLAVPVQDAEIAADRLWRAGVRAIEEVDVDSRDGDDRVELRTVLAADDAINRQRLGALPPDWLFRLVEIDPVPSQAWRDYAKPIVISPRLTIVPAWQQPLAPSGEPDELVIAIEPGAAFGLGDHPTTRLSAAALDRGDLAGASVLDVGCGTGVLAVIAARRGATVTAIDIAEAAREATLDNATRNNVTIDVSTTSIGDIGGSFDVVAANILGPTLVAMASDLRRLVGADGRLVISGVLCDRYDHVTAALAPLAVVAAEHLDGWSVIEMCHDL